MKKLLIHITMAFCGLMLFACSNQEETEATVNTHAPKLLLTQNGADFIMAHQDNVLIEKSLGKLRTAFNKAVEKPLEFPQPLDAGGGYSHETHKANYQNALTAATLYLLESDTAALAYAKEILIGYAAMYPNLSTHPEGKTQAPGKLFWQILNEEVSLVYLIQAFDAINTALSENERATIITGLFEPMVSFIKDESASTFNKIHNHAMWGVAGVGMAGYVLDHPEWVDAALNGGDKSGNSGYFKQIDQLFSPDGYYSEGPYYQRYALMPLVILAQAIEANQPEIKVLEYKDGVILKTIETTVQLSACNGYFFPLNDAVKAKSIETPELGYALPLVFDHSENPDLWVEAMKQNGNVVLTDALVGLHKKKCEPFKRNTLYIKDGPKGESGALAILRSDPFCDGTTALLKFGTHGMGHGHFDQLGILWYGHGNEILADYGAARYHNIPQKFGGRYLPENDTWANQTIAHNTLVVDEKNQYDGDDDLADQHHGDGIYFINTDSIKAAAAKNNTAYPGINLQRHVALVTLEGLGAITVDITTVNSEQSHQLDLPFHYKGDIVFRKPAVQMEANQLTVLGKENGYQHLWLRGASETTKLAQSTLVNGNSFYTISTTATQPFNVLWVQTGANDPEANLLHQEALIYRSKEKSQTWVSVLEPHGDYNTIHEKTSGAATQISGLTAEENNGVLTLKITTVSSQEFQLEFDLSENQNFNNPHISISKV
ncbi:heparinase II/III domain-containing protein [Owenweeksia hongkongensis]|uniref:heparinase II/III domain-containing protein n=1 Tax=Owenweeksia hongkongensis TaxID=253245 RepID=UPI003A91816B